MNTPDFHRRPAPSELLGDLLEAGCVVEIGDGTPVDSLGADLDPYGEEDFDGLL